MGLLNLAGELIVGTLKVGVAVGGALLGAAFESASQAQNVRNSSGSMSNAELLNGYLDKSNSMSTRIGYGAALQDRYRK